MNLKTLIKHLTPSRPIIPRKIGDTPIKTIEDMEVKVFDRNKECIGDITNITVEKHADKTYIMINVKLEDLK